MMNFKANFSQVKAKLLIFIVSAKLNVKVNDDFKYEGNWNVMGK
jgi:hypothetical protein